jgi:predicted aspartyl protease
MAFVDTGADGTFVPAQDLARLNLERSDQTAVHPYFGAPRLADIYVIDLLVGTRRLPAVEVVADEEHDEAILGRNVLNKLILLLDGPGAATDVLEKRPDLR